jgi:LmbE family N-acetylglucosaminyl deacetylase
MAEHGLVRRLRAWTAHRFLTRVHRITHRLPLELRAVARSRVLVVAPHMDDAEVACGGTLALHRRVGSEVGVLYTTDSGGAGGQALPAEPLRRVRRAEAEEAARRLGLEILEVGSFPDGSLSLHEDASAERVAHWLERRRPELVFCPFPADNHRDHQSTAAAVALAIGSSGWRGEVWCYEVWSALWPNVAVDVTSVLDEKSAAIACYASQTATMPYAEAALGLNRFRGLRVGVAAAEAFHASPAGEYRRLCRELFRA